MRQRNIDVLAGVIDIVDRFNEPMYKAWQETITARDDSRMRYIGRLFKPMARNYPSLIEHEMTQSPILSSLDTHPLKYSLEAVLLDIPHLHLTRVSTAMRRGPLIRVTTQGHVKHHYTYALARIKDLGYFTRDGLEPGMGEEMPFHFSMGVDLNFHSYPIEKWMPAIPLCNDFFFHDHNMKREVTMFFRDEEDFLEALLKVNSDANS